ncbi:hypothetical protein MNBD_GAMMA11-2206 [hydrothermal vent metagenome]|uniref:Uncharacterized protein n=1 Tax=hydrothermal vent metagenome TaxID=652676 RepID=A0A3B0XSL7_9ZZZZ
MIFSMQSNTQRQDAPSFQRNVSSTAKLFSFDCSVYMTEGVWKDCVELTDIKGRNVDELAILQRLRHVLFMASTALHGRMSGPECEFSIHRVPNDGKAQRPEKTMLKLVAISGDPSQITIRHLDE